MRLIKFFELIQMLDKKELKQFKAFVQFNSKREVTAEQLLVNYYVEKRLKNSDFKPNLEQMQKVVFPNKPTSTKRLENKVSDVVLLLEKYFAWLEVQENEYLQQELLKNQMRKRDSSHYYGIALNNCRKIVEQDITIENTFSKRSELSLEEYYQPEFLKHDKIKAKNLFKNLVIEFYHACLLTKSKIAIEAKSRRSILGPESVEISKEVEDWLDLSKIKEVKNLPIEIRFNFLIYSLLDSSSLEQYYQLKEVFVNNISFLSTINLNYIASNMLNFIFRNISNFPSRQAAAEEIDLLFFNNYLLINNEIAPDHYSNISIFFSTTSGLAIKAKQILELGDKILPTSQKSATLEKCKAFYHFGIGEYDACIKLANKASIKSNIQTRQQLASLALRSNYELSKNNPTIEFDEHVFRYQRNLKNTKLSPQTKEAYHNFSRYALELTYLDSAKVRSKFKTAVKAESQLLLKSWLLEKCEEGPSN